MTDRLKDHKIVSEEEWVKARKALLKKEKEFTTLRDQLSQQRRDLPWVAVSRAPYSKLAAYQKRMGWDFKWVSSYDTDFNFDYHVSFTREELAKKEDSYNYTAQAMLSEREGVSIFFKDPAGRVFHTYSAYARGIDMLNVAYHYLDLVPKGRDEVGHAFPQFWVRRRDEYGDPHYINTE
jgi:predicted dithiol-disulfide oxidoreductase (DUF899 family)